MTEIVTKEYKGYTLVPLGMDLWMILELELAFESIDEAKSWIDKEEEEENK